MPCYHPIPAQRTSAGPWRLNPPIGNEDASIPCGKCLGCRTSVQMSWTYRCTHEASLHDYNTFITLTYDDDHCPSQLIPYDLTTFLKRLRRARSRNESILTDGRRNIRYLACGEYGENTHRPHYHLNAFNLTFADAKPYDDKLYTSQTLDNLWGKGAAKLAPFTPATAAYVAGYITKHGHRTYADADGVELQQPFKRQSTKPAIGREWLEKYHRDIARGYLIHEGRPVPIPRYYRKMLERFGQVKDGPLTQEETSRKYSNDILSEAIASPRQPTDKHHPERLSAAERIHFQHIANKHRRLE